MYSSPSHTPLPPYLPTLTQMSSSKTAMLCRLVDLQHNNVKYHLNGPKFSSVEVSFYSKILLLTTIILWWASTVNGK